MNYEGANKPLVPAQERGNQLCERRFTNSRDLHTMPTHRIGFVFGIVLAV